MFILFINKIKGMIYVELIVDRIVNWLKEKVDEAGVKGLTVGLSGGLDSAVVAHLIKRAFPDQSLAVIMPIHSNPNDIEHALNVAESCGIKYTSVDLTN